MISPLAITLALAFWAPYNNGQPVCAGGVNVHEVGFGATPGPSFIARDTATGELIPQCEMFADPSIKYLPVARQCAWVARNIGWSFMGLPNSTDPLNLMYHKRWVTPRACHTTERSRRT